MDTTNRLSALSEKLAADEYQDASHHVRSSVVTLTAKEAQKLLAKNTHNRTVREELVYLYASEIQEGRWLFNGEAIKISRTGVILDGQHRLLALSICDEGASITTLLVTGLADSAQSTMDQGVKRNASDILSLAGIENVDSQVAAGIKVFMIWEADLLFSETKATRALTSSPAMLAWAQKNPNTVELIHYGVRFRNIPIRNGVLLAFYAKAKLAHGDTVDAFMTALLDGTDLHAGSPVLALRNRLIKIRANSVRLSDRDAIGILINTFTHYRLNHRITRIQMPNGRSFTRGNFPSLREGVK